MSDPSRACATGLAGRLEPEVAAGLAALTRVGRALTATGSLNDIARHALGEMRTSLDLEAVVLYVPAARGRPILHRYLELGTRRRRADRRRAARLRRGRVAAGVRRRQPDGVPRAGRLVRREPVLAAGRVLARAAAEDGRAPARRGDRLARRAGDLDPLTATLLALLGEQLGSRARDRAAARGAAARGTRARAHAPGRRGPRRPRPGPRAGSARARLPRLRAATERRRREPRAPARGRDRRAPARTRAPDRAVGDGARGQPERGRRGDVRALRQHAGSPSTS